MALWMKAHIRVDADSGVVHKVVGTLANVHDVTQAPDLLHGSEKVVFGDAGYRGVQKRDAAMGKNVIWQISMIQSKRRKLTNQPQGHLLEQIENLKVTVRAKVEHPFYVVKTLFKHRKARYKGMAKNSAQLSTLFDMANLFMMRRRLIGPDTLSAS